jgi:uncharacterized membrane-anchored protein YitT (DUF2179 family)
MTMKTTRKAIIDMVQLILGNAMSACAMACFALPYDMVVAGVSGIGRISNNYLGFSVTVTVYAVNIALFIIGFLILGKRFAATIAVGTFLYPFFLGLFQNISAMQHLVDDPLLAAICAGVLDGVGIGMVIRMGGSTGGIDVPPIILNRKFGLKVAPVMSAIDIGIFIIQIPMTSTNGIILGILYTLVYSVVMNHILVLNQGGVQTQIFSKKLSAEINEKLLEMGYGTTIFPARGGYIQEEFDVVSCVVSNRNLNRVKRLVLNIDPTAFITISNVSEVNGNGFTTWFRDEDYVPVVSERREGIDLMQESPETE